MGSVNPDPLPPGLEPDEPRAVGSFDLPPAVAEVVGPGGVLYLFYGKTALKCVVVSRTQFLAAVSADRNGVGLFHLLPAIENQREAALDDPNPSLVPSNRASRRGEVPLRNA